MENLIRSGQWGGAESIMNLKGYQTLIQGIQCAKLDIKNGGKSEKRPKSD